MMMMSHSYIGHGGYRVKGSHCNWQIQLLAMIFLLMKWPGAYKIGLLCVQEDSAKRPRMASIVAALDGESITLPFPTLPSFLTDFSVEIKEAVSDQSATSCRSVQKTTEAYA